MEPIRSFYGVHRWLSNFWPVAVRLDGQFYRTVEHAYQAAKSNDVNYRCTILNCRTPGAAKRFGRHAVLVPHWNEKKLEVMEDLVRQKFTNAALREALLATGDAMLIEGNNWNDTFWGQCSGVGENNLGKIIMKIRDEIRKG